MTFWALKDEIKAAILQQAGECADFEARQLIMHFLKAQQGDFLNGGKAEYTDELRDAVARRQKGEPLQYILGVWEFYGRSILCRAGVLIPRPETELLSETAIEFAKQSGRLDLKLLELCCGSGAAGLTVAAEIPLLKAVFSDISDAAIELCAENAKLFGLANIQVVKKDALSDYDYGDRFDIIIANPPYIDKKDIAEVQADVLEFEPHLALFADEEGLLFYRAITQRAKQVLADGGLLAMEIGIGQSEAVAELMKQAGFSSVTVKKDYSGIDRIVWGLNKIEHLC